MFPCCNHKLLYAYMCLYMLIYAVTHSMLASFPLHYPTCSLFQRRAHNQSLYTQYASLPVCQHHRTQ